MNLSPFIDKVLLVDGLKHNLFSISQFYDNKCNAYFWKKVNILDNEGLITFTDNRQGNIYERQINIIT